MMREGGQSVALNLTKRTTPISDADISALFNGSVGQAFATRLQGGASEPFYQPATHTQPATIFYREDFIRSALHEVAHWCLAGAARRALPDYGYWYSDDDRALAAQSAFFAVEVRPQALEAAFCEELGIAFRPSADNLSIDIPEQLLKRFSSQISECLSQWQRAGYPERAAQFLNVLQAYFRDQDGEDR
jgi:elongation factor P hydroxylase